MSATKAAIQNATARGDSPAPFMTGQSRNPRKGKLAIHPMAMKREARTRKVKLPVVILDESIPL